MARSHRSWSSVESECSWKPLDGSHLGVTSDLYLGEMAKCSGKGKGWCMERVSKAGASCCDLVRGEGSRDWDWGGRDGGTRAKYWSQGCWNYGWVRYERWEGMKRTCGRALGYCSGTGVPVPELMRVCME